MSKFTYIARKPNGEKIDGQVEASDRRAAMSQIERMGFVPVSIRDAATAVAPEAPPSWRQFKLPWQTKSRMSQRDLLLFSTELSDLLASGMTLGRGLTTLANRRTGQPGDAIIRELRDEIIKGASLSEAMARHPETFSQLYVSMIKVGEATGALGEVMNRLVTHYERLQEVREKVLMALIYPAIVMALGVATMLFSMVFVIPKFAVIFAELGKALPLPTRILIGVSTFMVRYGIFVIAALIFAVIAFLRYVKQPPGQQWWHQLLLRMPLIRNIIAASSFANFARTLSTLLANGVPVLQALAIVEKTMTNTIIAAEIHNARERVTDGTSISGPLAAGAVFPPLMTDMLAIGEQTGDMSGALTHIAKRYENDLNRSVKIFTTALEPILIVIVALMVGFVAISILMAVFNLTSGMKV